MNARVAGERFLDTNIFIRHVTGDHPAQSPAANALIVRIEEGQERCWTSHLTVAECIWVLTGVVYRVPRAAAVASLEPILALPGVRLADKHAMLRALQIYRTTSLSFIDAYHGAIVGTSRSREMYSWDRGFDRIAGLTRIEPAAP